MFEGVGGGGLCGRECGGNVALGSFELAAQHRAPHPQRVERGDVGAFGGRRGRQHARRVSSSRSPGAAAARARRRRRGELLERLAEAYYRSRSASTDAISACRRARDGPPRDAARALAAGALLAWAR
ncbi:hypothetical protein, partial [Mycolicibacterium vanbaalenii]|uniref:hypothetical protein n=1 Tax=Mycolicibacterium vanbaalenii TaxID=110539 RepID=UPI0021F2FB67